MNIPDSGAKRIVIVGGGFGGIQLARKLRGNNFQVVVIDKHNYHAFQPLLYQVATAGLEPGSIAYPFRKIFNFYRDYFFRMAELIKVEAAENKIITNIGELKYDYLVLCTGATTNYFGMQNLAANAMSMKTVAEALDIRSLLLQNLEEAILLKGADERDKLMNIVIVGGGPTGVELAGAIAELKKDILPRDYPDLDLGLMDIHLIESNGRLIKEMSEKSSEKALSVLKAMGVDVMLGVRVTDFDGSVVSCNNGSQIRSKIVIWAAGVTGVVPAGLDPTVLASGRILVDRYNRVQGLENVFALGDVAKMVTDKYPNGHPMVAQPAMQQGVLLAKNLIALQRNGTLTQFEYKDLGSMATIGRNKAVTEIGKLKLYGWIAWMAWLMVHIYQLVGFRNKMVVMVNWAQNYLRHSRDLRLIIRPFRKK